MASSAKLVCLVLMVMAVTAPLTQATINCGQLTNKLTPCLSYLKAGGAVPITCCSGVKSLKSAAKTTPDRRAACDCLKSAARGISGINYGLAASLPGKCGVYIPFNINPSTECNKVK